MGEPTQSLACVNAQLERQQWPDAREFDGVLITGSGSMVSDREPWSERAATWLATCHEQGVPMLGICYGHQLLAHALGGVVHNNPRGREIGTKKIKLISNAQNDPLFKRLGESFWAHTTHLQSVLTPPPEAEVLAQSDLDDCHAFRLGDSTWGMQFHPEFSVRAMHAYVDARATAMKSEGIDVKKIRQAVRPAPQARNLLKRFVEFCRR